MSMFYIPRGPILDFKDKELVLFYFEELKKEAKKHHCLFIKFDPMIHVNDYKSYEANDNKYKDTDLYLNIFKEIGRSIMDLQSMFKDNFNPTINELIGEFDLPVNKMLYNLSQIAYKLLKK